MMMTRPHAWKKAALTVNIGTYFLKVLTCKDFVPTFCEIADIWVFTNCQFDVLCLNVF